MPEDVMLLSAFRSVLKTNLVEKLRTKKTEVERKRNGKRDEREVESGKKREQIGKIP